MSRVDEVISCFRGGLNCAQAVFSVYGPLYGMERQQCICVAAPFGAGIARTQDICGAVTGALMVLGLRYCHIGLDVKAMKARAAADAREFMRQFAGNHGSIRCRELLSRDITTEEGMKAAKDAGDFERICANYVRDAAVLLEDFLALP